MKNFTYHGKSNLIFSHGDKDYLVHGTGPHELPEDAPIVKTHLTLGNLAEHEENKDTNPKKSK